MDAKKPVTMEAGISAEVQKTNAHWRRVHDAEGEAGTGKFFLLLKITAGSKDAYVPVSIASGKKPTGFVYEIRGTAPGAIATTDITAEGDDVSQITLGTILYARIPAGKSGLFRVIVDMRGKLGAKYQIVINRIQYKFDPSDARYEKLAEDLASESVKFS